MFRRLSIFVLLVAAGGLSVLLVDSSDSVHAQPTSPILVIQNVDYDGEYLTGRNKGGSDVFLGTPLRERSRWQIESAANGRYVFIRNAVDGAYLRVKRDGTVVTTRVRKGVERRYHWTIDDSGPVTRIAPRVGTLFLDVDQGAKVNVKNNKTIVRGMGWDISVIDAEPTPTVGATPPPTPPIGVTPQPPTPTPTVVVTPPPPPTPTVDLTPSPTPTVIVTPPPPPTPTVDVNPTPTPTSTPPPTATPGDPGVVGLRIISGVVHDAVEAAGGIELPVVGAMIIVGDQATTTDGLGEFELVVVPGIYQFEILGSTAEPNDANLFGYTDYSNALEIPEGDSPLALETFYATPFGLDLPVEVDPAQETVVDAPDLAQQAGPGSVAELTIAPNSAVNDDTGELYDGTLSITQVPNCCTPSSMPAFVVAENPLIVTVQPLGISFDPPAPLSLPNTNDYEPGTILNLWSLNPETGAFEIKGEGQVNAEGTTVETITGGLVQTDWHFFVPTDPGGNGAPFWNFSQPQSRIVAAGAPVETSVAGGFTEPDGDVLTYSLTSEVWPGGIDSLTGTITGPALSAGQSIVVTVIASDGALSTAQDISIEATDLPIYVGPSDFFLPEQGIFEIDFASFFIDPLGGDLTFELIENGVEASTVPSAILDPVTGVFSVDTAELDFDFYDIVIGATNANGTFDEYVFMQGFALDV